MQYFANNSTSPTTKHPATLPYITTLVSALASGDIHKADAQLTILKECHIPDSYAKRDFFAQALDKILLAVEAQLPSLKATAVNIPTAKLDMLKNLGRFLDRTFVTLSDKLFIDKDLSPIQVARAAYIIAVFSGKICKHFLQLTAFLDTTLTTSSKLASKDARLITALVKEYDRIGLGKLLRGEDPVIPVQAKKLSILPVEDMELEMLQFKSVILVNLLH